MKRKISFLLVAVLLLATLIPALPIFAADETAGGETVVNTFNANDENPKISTAADYIAFFEAVYRDRKNYLGKTVTLMQDITFNDTTVNDWYAKDDAINLSSNVVGKENTWAAFRGTFEGGGHTLKGVIVKGSISVSCAGLFPFIADGGTIQNLKVDSFYVCSTNTTTDWSFGQAGIGGLIGYAAENTTIDRCTLTNGIVTSVKDGQGSIGGLIGTYNSSKSYALKITDTVVSNVSLDAGESLCENLGGLCGIFVSTCIGSDKPVLDFSGSVIQPIGSMNSENPLKPVGVWSYQAAPNAAFYKIINRSIGTDPKAGVWLNAGTTTLYPNGANFGKNNDDYCDGEIWKSGCYGYRATPTVKLLGVQPATNGSNDLRFVGLIKKVDLSLITDLGFELTVGDKTIGTDKIQCTKVYNSILAAGETLTAPEGYYYFTFVVTGVEDGTALNINASATVAGKLCTTTTGSYTYTRAAS